jgi:hypothetical protein
MELLTSRELFRPIHPPNTLENNLGPEQYKGVIDPVEAAKVSTVRFVLLRAYTPERGPLRTYIGGGDVEAESRGEQVEIRREGKIHKIKTS